MSKASSSTLIVTILLVFVSSLQGAPPGYTITPVTDLFAINRNYSEAYDVNDDGYVAGMAYNCQGQEPKAFSWNFQNGMVELDVESCANAVNSKGRIVGWKWAGYNNKIAVMWDGQNVTDLGNLGSNYIEASDINESSQIVGAGGPGPWVWENGVMTALDTSGGAKAINDHGNVVGYQSPGYNQPEHAHYWGNGQNFSLGTLPGSSDGAYSQAWDINELNQVVGFSTTSYHPYPRPFLWENGVMQELPSHEVASRASSINNQGQIVGWDYYNAKTNAIFWDEEIAYNLNDYLVENPGWFLRRAYAISDTGYIVGAGDFQGAYQGYLLTPIPEPATLSLLAVGAVALIRRRRK